jgi:hypothetical protein
MWEPHVMYEDHLRAGCTVWVLCAPYWRQMVPYGGHMHRVGTMSEPCEPCWSPVYHMGVMWEPDGAIWEVNGTIWKLYVSQMGPYESGVRCMGATCAIWEPDGAIWDMYAAIEELHAPDGTM